ncbi:hypothetical protein ACPFUC_003692, partial [Vibrio cholerae]
SGTFALIVLKTLPVYKSNAWRLFVPGSLSAEHAIIRVGLAFGILRLTSNIDKFFVVTVLVEYMKHIVEQNCSFAVAESHRHVTESMAPAKQCCTSLYLLLGFINTFDER